MNLPFMSEEYRMRQDSSQAGMVCRQRWGNGRGEQEFGLCQHPSVTCSHPALGRIQKKRIVYIVPEGQSCGSVSARNALLNSFQVNPGLGDYSATSN
jgi:hypothetical protein